MNEVITLMKFRSIDLVLSRFLSLSGCKIDFCFKKNEFAIFWISISESVSKVS